MKASSILFALLIAAVAPTGVAQEVGEAVELLFVQSAPESSFQDGTLALRGVSPATIFFSGRPSRIAGHMSTSGFVRRWANGADSFSDDPPNAVLSAFVPGGTTEQVVLVLRNPREAGGDLTYAVEILEGEIPTEAGHSSLFIDGKKMAGCTSASDDPAFSGYPCWADNAFSTEH